MGAQTWTAPGELFCRSSRRAKSNKFPFHPCPIPPLQKTKKRKQQTKLHGGVPLASESRRFGPGVRRAGFWQGNTMSGALTTWGVWLCPLVYPLRPTVKLKCEGLVLFVVQEFTGHERSYPTAHTGHNTGHAAAAVAGHAHKPFYGARLRPWAGRAREQVLVRGCFCFWGWLWKKGVCCFWGGRCSRPVYVCGPTKHRGSHYAHIAIEKQRIDK